MENEQVLVCKHNNLINATYKLDLSEQKLILAISSMVNPNDEEFKEYYLKINDFADLLGIDLKKNSALYTRLKRKSSILLSKRITIHEEDGDLQTTWFASIKYFNNEGKIAFCFAPRLKQYYLQLQQYTKYKLKNVIRLNYSHSIRLYEILKQYENLKVRVINIDKFRQLIGLEENQYIRFYDLKKNVLLKSQEELKEKTDIKFEFEEIKTARKVTSIKFFIKENSKNNYKNNSKSDYNDEESIGNEDDNIKELYGLFKDNAIDIKSIKKIFENANGDMLKIKKVYEYSQTQKINNFVGFMLKMVQGDNFIEPEKKDKKNKFNNFEQRKYDFDDLEPKLLGWDDDIIEDSVPKNVDTNDVDVKNNAVTELLKSVMEEQSKSIFGEIKYKTWLSYSVDNLEVVNSEVNLYFMNEFAMSIFEKDFKMIVIELINSVDKNLKLNIKIKGDV